LSGAFVGDKNFSVIKMHGTTIKIRSIRLLMTLGHADRSVISQFGFAHVNQVYWFPVLFTILRLPWCIVFCLNLHATQKIYTVC